MNTEVDEEEMEELDTTDALVKSMLKNIEAESIKPDRLIEMYEEL